MKKGSLLRFTVQLFVIGAIAATPACKDSRAQARKRLEKQGIAMTPAELIRASASGNEDVVKSFVEAGYDLNVSNFSDSHTPLTAAVAGQHEDVTRTLLEGGADVNATGPHGNTPLMLAIDSGNVPMAKLLLERGASAAIVNTEEFRALELAAFRGSPEMVRLIAPKAQPQLNRALHVASMVADAPTVAALLESGANVNAMMLPNERTPLMMAAEHGKMEIAKVLLDNRADLTPRDKDGKTALMLAIENRYQDLAATLLAKQNDPAYQPISAADAPRVSPQGMEEEPIEATADVNGTAHAAEAELLAEVQGNAASVVAAETGEVTEARLAAVDAAAARAKGEVGAATSLRASDKAGSPLLQQLREKLTINDRKETAAGDASAAPEIATSATPRADEGPVATNTAFAPAKTAGEPAETHVAAEPSAAEVSRTATAHVAAAEPTAEASASANLPLRLSSVRRETLPLRYTGGSGGAALVEVGGQGGTIHRVKKGQQIPGMQYRVLRIASRRSQDKFGEWQDASTLYLEDTRTHEKLALVKNLEAESPSTGATLTTEGDGKVLEVTRGQTFTLPNQPDRQFVLEDVRQDQVVLQEVSTGEMYTVGR